MSIGSVTRVRGLLPFLVTIAVLAAAIGLFGFSASLNPVDVLLGRGRQLSAPNLTGMPLPSAKVEADRLGLKYKVRSAFSLTVQRGSVIRQDPLAGKAVRVGDSIELTVSKGENSAPMPDAVGKLLSDVRKPLEDASIKVVVEQVFSETVADGVVISQSPEPGVTLRGGERARFQVSKGAEKRPVPDVAGMSPTGAAFLLGQAGLTLGEVTSVDNPTVPEGAVVTADPVQGTSLAKGAVVALQVSAGPPAVAVPSVVGQSSDAALASLSALGFRTETAVKVLPEGDPGIAKVLEQSPPAGDSLRPNRSVTVVIGVKPPAPPVTTTTLPPTEDSGSTTTTVPATTTTKAGGR